MGRGGRPAASPFPLSAPDADGAAANRVSTNDCHRLIAPLEFLHQKIAGPHAERHDRKRGVLARIRSEAGGVHDVEIIDVVSPLELIEH